MDYMNEREANLYSPLTLAFLGDGVYDTLVREYLLVQGNKPVGRLHDEKVKLVCAEYQSEAYGLILGELSEQELSVLKRGRNSVSGNVPKHAEAVQYRRATAVECLFGYLWLTGKHERLYSLFDFIIKNNNSREEVENHG